MGRGMGEFYTRSPVYARAMPRFAWAALAASVLVAGCVPALSFQNATVGKPLRVPASVSRPEGPGPFPAVVLMHGCHGVSDSNRDWAQWLRERGYVALVVDSWKPRRLHEACTPGEELPNTARFDDNGSNPRPDNRSGWLEGDTPPETPIDALVNRFADANFWDPSTQLRLRKKSSVPPRPDGAPNRGQVSLIEMPREAA